MWLVGVFTFCGRQVEWQVHEQQKLRKCSLCFMAKTIFQDITLERGEKAIEASYVKISQKELIWLQLQLQMLLLMRDLL